MELRGSRVRPNCTDSRLQPEEDHMTRKTLAIVSCLLLFAASSVFAQSRQGNADPISGTWTGELTPDGGQPVTLTFALTLKGSAVTGTFTGFPTPGDVKKGTFDAKTGALKLELGKQGEPAVLLTLDGKVEKGVATGKVTGDRGGVFKLTKKP